MKYNCILHPTRKLTLPKEEIPDTVDVSKVLELFSQHRYHIGATPQYSKTKSKVDMHTHVVKNIELTEDGDIDIIFEFIHTNTGHHLMMEYQDGLELKIVPVVSESGINIDRFDLQPKE